NDNIGEFTNIILEEDKIRNKQREFSHMLFKGTMTNLEVIDAEIQKHLKDWDYKSIGKVEKAIMRLAGFEIMIEGTDKRIIINEAIELAKALSDDRSPRFINAVLDAIGKESANIEKPVEEETLKEKPE
ncbi:MAG TPA: transcription antitermination factor NusB, partial [Sulfurovum sp.]|nr:transcription antitermination factor NusB [Sulfurovum sp.]